MASKVKKSAKKKAAKKSTKKNKNPFTVKQQEHAFYLSDGKAVKNLLHLAEILPSINNQIFEHHVNQERNDFSNWVNGVFKEDKLANRIKKMDKTEMQFEIYRFLARKLW